MMNVLSTCDDAQKWNMRSDVRYDIEVFFIENYMSFHEIQAHFTIDILMVSNDYSVLAEALKLNVERMGKKNSKNGKRLRKVS